MPSLTEEDLVVEMARLVALLGDAHTSLQPAQFSGEAWLPLRFRWFSDGLFITEASYEHRDLLGAEVLSFGPTSAEDAHQLLAPLISHDNEVWLRETSPGLMAVPFVLRQAGVIPDETNISLAIRRRDGVETQATIRPSLGAARAPLKTLPRESEMPGYLSGRFENYWFERVAGGSALYIRYAAMHEDPGLSIADFTRGVMEEFDGAPVERVIIDVRQNGGGFATVSNTMRLALENRNSDRALRVYVLIDGGTFSAAKNAAITFRESLKAITVGEPTGGSPTEYTGVRRLTLPNHGVSLIYSSGRVAFPGYDQPSLMPDLPVAWTSSDYFEGRDAALEAALKHER